MLSNWSADHVVIKHIIARCSTSDGIIFIISVNEIRNIIVQLSSIELIIDNIVGDWETKNRSAMQSVATHIVDEVLSKTFYV